MTGNLGATTLRRRRRSGDRMREFDQLPPELRAWLSTAILAWRPGSVHRAFSGALARTKDRAQALEELDRLERSRIARDARRIWGPHHPATWSAVRY